jgi:hypothetical protein
VEGTQQTMSKSPPEATSTPHLRRALGLWDLVLYGLIVIQPTAPMPVYGVMSMRSHGYALITVLLAMVAMMFTAISYGKMASAYPSAGSAFTYVGREIHPALGYVTGWSMAMDYVLNPLICTILCGKLAMNFFPEIPYAVWVVAFVAMFTVLNLQGIKTSAHINSGLVAVMGVVILLFLAAAIHYVHATPHGGVAYFTRPFYDPKTFSVRAILGGTSLAVLTYIGFDGISTLSEEARNPRRNIMLATVLVCLLTGLLALHRGLCRSARLAWSHELSRCGHSVCVCCRKSRRAVAFCNYQYDTLGGDLRLGAGCAIGRCTPVLRHGPKRRAPSQFFWGLSSQRGASRETMSCWLAQWHSSEQ